MIRTASTAASNECCSFRLTANSRWRFSIGHACPFIFFGGADRFHTPRRSFLIIFRFILPRFPLGLFRPSTAVHIRQWVVTLLSRLANTFASTSPMKKSSLLDISLCSRRSPRTRTNLATCPLGNKKKLSRSCNLCIAPVSRGPSETVDRRPLSA